MNGVPEMIDYLKSREQRYLSKKVFIWITVMIAGFTGLGVAASQLAGSAEHYAVVAAVIWEGLFNFSMVVIAGITLVDMVKNWAIPRYLHKEAPPEEPPNA